MGKDEETLDLGSWFILRMASADTLRMFDVLRRRGFNVWTPVERKVVRRPRTKAKADMRFALMPSYVFAGVEHLTELAALASVPPGDNPRFTIFRHFGTIPLVGDGELGALRSEEARTERVFEKHKRMGIKGPIFHKGAEFTMGEGSFAGLTGMVDGGDGQFTLVSFEGFPVKIKIASCILEKDAVWAAGALPTSKAA